MPTIAVSQQPLQLAGAGGMDFSCLQRRMAPFAFSVGAVAFGTFGCVEAFARSQGFRTRGDGILAGAIALWNLFLPVAHCQDSGGKKGSDEDASEESQ